MLLIFQNMKILGGSMQRVLYPGVYSNFQLEAKGKGKTGIVCMDVDISCWYYI